MRAKSPVVHRGRRCTVLGFDKPISKSAIRATGMLTQKMARHVHCVRKPPRMGPTEVRPAGDAEEQGQRLAPLSKGEGLHHDRQRGREHDRTTGALDDPERDDPRFGQGSLGGQSAHARGPCEKDDPEDHHLRVADGVGQPTTEREESR